MSTDNGADFALLVLAAFDAMVDEVREALEQAGHPGLTVANEFAMRAIDAGADSAASLARAVGVSRQAAAKTIASLEALGYVTRGVSSADGRKKQLLVTEQGRDAVAIGAGAFDLIYRRWRREVGSQADVTIAALNQLVANSRGG